MGEKTLEASSNCYFPGFIVTYLLKVMEGTNDKIIL